jgi:FtsP/CotA-like multicopper oxidase with cupredoxin domain
MLPLHPRVRATLLVAGTLLLLPASLQALDALPPDAPPDLPRVEPNDNRTAAGRLENGVLVVRLEVREGVWMPDGPRGPRFTIQAFAEPGRPLQAPAPLIRVSSGTRVRVVVRNTLAKPMWVYGLGEQRGLHADSMLVAPGESSERTFTAGDAGTFYYGARTDFIPQKPPHVEDDSQLLGALVIDAPGARPRDRVLVVTQRFGFDTTTRSGLAKDPVLAINGLSWPHTQRIEATQGDTLRWRVVNLTILDHPFHLHGFYFDVEARGTGARDTSYATSQRRKVVTEAMLPFTTMQMAWVPAKPGNWILHCHFAGHITSWEGLEQDRRLSRPVSAGDPHASHSQPLVRPASFSRTPATAEPVIGHEQHKMAGLVVGITVRPRGAQPAPAPIRRRLSLEVRSKANVYGEYVGYAYVLGGSAEAQDASAMPLPGPTLVLTKDERVAITIVNRSHEPAAVHWHGIELESFPDGVPGWSGAGRHTLPMVAPGDSFTVTFTPPRAGTFMYHSHANEMQQISSGLYGAIVVVDPSVPRDATRERILLFSDQGPLVNVIRDPLPPILLNGKRDASPLEVQAGVTYRLRLINIRSESFLDVGLYDGETPVEWKVVAVDGADVPTPQSGPATLSFSSGMIRDVEFTPKSSGKLTLRYANGRMPKELLDARTVDVVVR